ncbi:MAG: LysR family transcriptional regulator [Rhodospirillaceae bacterium]|nr:LysR family transcriptional regulator [Rhodospirillaceae bacterium]
MDIRRLEHFLALLDFKQFNRAARELGVSQQAVSKAIAKLEEEVGVTLFERSAYGVSPTEQAKALEQHARTIIAEARLAMANLNALNKSKRAALNIGIGPSQATHFMPAAINAFRAVRPGIGIRAFVEFAPSLQQMLIAGDVDLVVNAPPADFKFASNLTVHRLFEEVDMLAVRAAHPLAGKTSVTITDLLPFSWLAPRQNRSLWQSVCNAYADQGLPPPVDVMITDSEQLKLGLMLDSDFLSIIDTNAMAQEVNTGLLRCIHVNGLTMRRPAVLSHRSRGQLSSAARTMMTIVRRLARQQQGARIAGGVKGGSAAR